MPRRLLLLIPPLLLLALSCRAHCSEIDYEILVIDDNSPDGTQEVVRELQRVYGEDRWVRTP